MSFVFPYQYELIEGKKIPYPIVIGQLQTIRGPRDYSFILDTGADTTTFPHFMIHLLGLKEKNLKQSVSQGIGRQLVKVWEGKTTILIDSTRLAVTCNFTDNDQTPFLLGKIDVFDRFNIYFNNDKQQVEFHELAL